MKENGVNSHIMNRLDNQQALLILISVVLLCHSNVFGQTSTQHVVLNPIRAVAGESRAIAAERGSISFAFINSSRISPTLAFPIRVDVVPGTQRLNVTIPPATPAGEYTLDLIGRDPDGQILAATLHVMVDPVTVPLAGAANRVPVILLNGWQLLCTNSDSTLKASEATFGKLASLLQSDGVPVVFFNNCLYEGVSIEQLAAQLKNYLVPLKYTDGTSVTQVDLVAHSMGGLIARAYLSGKGKVSGSFAMRCRCVKRTGSMNTVRLYNAV